MKNRNDNYGFTLLEMVIVAVILSIVFAAMFQLLFAANAAYETSTVLQDMDKQAVRAIKRMSTELNNARAGSGGVPGPGGKEYVGGQKVDDTFHFIEIQVPVNVDDGSGNMVPYTVVGTTISINWGAGNNIGHWIRYEFQSLETISEPTTGVDYNRDGDTNDTFQRGNIVRSVFDDEATNAARNMVETRILAGPYIFVRDWSDPEIDVERNQAGRTSIMDGNDADTLDDPIFRVCDDNGVQIDSGENVRICIFAMKSVHKRPEMIRRDSIVFPINKLYKSG